MLTSHGKYYTSLQPLVDSVLFMDMLSTISEESAEADKARFYLMYKKLLYRVIANVDIIIASCHDAGNEDLYLNFGPTVVIVDNATEASEPETFIPLLMYQGVQIRILLGNRRDTRLPIEQPSSAGLVQRQMSFFERMALNEVPIHKLTVQYLRPQQTHIRRHSEDLETKLAATMINVIRDKVSLRDRVCLCGADHTFGKCRSEDGTAQASKLRSTLSSPLQYTVQFKPPTSSLHQRARTTPPLKRIPENLHSPFF